MITHNVPELVRLCELGTKACQAQGFVQRPLLSRVEEFELEPSDGKAAGAHNVRAKVCGV